MQSSQSPPEQTADVEWRLGLAYAAVQRWEDAANHLGRMIERRDALNRDWQCLEAAELWQWHVPSSTPQAFLTLIARNLPPSNGRAVWWG